MTDTALITFEPSHIETKDTNLEALGAIKEAGLKLKTNGVDDKEALDTVHKKRMEVKALRTQIKNRRKEVTEGALKFQKDAIAYEKKLLEPLDQVYEHLEAEEQKVKDEKERIKKEKEEAEQKRQLEIEKRFLDSGWVYAPPVYQLNDGEAWLSAEDMYALPEEQIIEYVKMGEAHLEAQKKIKEAEEAELKAQEEAQKKAQEDLERQQKELADKQAELEAREAEVKAKEVEQSKPEPSSQGDIPGGKNHEPEQPKEVPPLDTNGTKEEPLLFVAGQDIKAGQTVVLDKSDGKLYLYNPI